MLEFCDDDFRKVILIDGKQIGTFVYNCYNKVTIEKKELERLKKIHQDLFMEQVYYAASIILKRPLSMYEIRSLSVEKYYKDEYTKISDKELEVLQNKYKMFSNRYIIEKNYNMSLNAFNTCFSYTTNTFEIPASNINDLINKINAKLKRISKNEFIRRKNEKIDCYMIRKNNGKRIYYYG